MIFCILQKHGCFNHRVVTLVADKLKKRWFNNRELYFGIEEYSCIRQPKGQLPSSSYNHNTLKTLITSSIPSSGYMKVCYCNIDLLCICNDSFTDVPNTSSSIQPCRHPGRDFWRWPAHSPLSHNSKHFLKYSDYRCQV